MNIEQILINFQPKTKKNLRKQSKTNTTQTKQNFKKNSQPLPNKKKDSNHPPHPHPPKKKLWIETHNPTKPKL